MPQDSYELTPLEIKRIERVSALTERQLKEAQAILSRSNTLFGADVQTEAVIALTQALATNYLAVTNAGRQQVARAGGVDNG